MNTAINYMYRDASNYKYCGVVVVSGSISFADLAPYLDDGLYFTPADVDLPHPGEAAIGYPGTDDHCWCELEEGDFEATEAEATVTRDELIERFRKAHADEWPAQHSDTYPVE